MPRLLLEGKSITELLAQVRAEHGPDVTIVAADKVRTRGIGGFFARESYALTVEIDEAMAMAATAAGHSAVREQPAQERAVDVQAPGTLLDLAAAIDAAEATENSVILATRPMHTGGAQPALSTASPEFTAILERLTALDAPTAEPAPEPAAEIDAYTRLREVLVEIAPHLDLGTSVPIVLVIPPAVPAEAPPTSTASTAAAIPSQGRHRRAAESAR